MELLKKQILMEWGFALVISNPTLVGEKSVYIILTDFSVVFAAANPSK